MQLKATKYANALHSAYANNRGGSGGGDDNNEVKFNYYVGAQEFLIQLEDAVNGFFYNVSNGDLAVEHILRGMTIEDIIQRVRVMPK